MNDVPRAVLLAQVLSLLLCVMGVTSGTLANKGIDAPTTQSLLNYLLLTCVCGAVHAKQHGWRLPHSRNAWYIYALLALLDVEANFIVTKAYQYTSITSVTLLDCFTIPAVMVLSCVVLRGGARYGMGHLFGALLSVSGLVCLVFTDQYSKTAGPKPLLGDVLVLLGATVYAVCNVSQERLLYDTSRWELLASVSAFASCFSGVQALILDHHAWAGSQWDGAALGALAGFALALFCFSLLIPSVLVLGGSTVLNLSLLTSDLWAAGARGIFFGGFGGTAPYFFFAFVLEVLGIGLYTLSGEARKIPPQCHSEREMGELTRLASDECDGHDEEERQVGEESRLLSEQDGYHYKQAHSQVDGDGSYKQSHVSRENGGRIEGSRMLGKQDFSQQDHCSQWHGDQVHGGVREAPSPRLLGKHAVHMHGTAGAEPGKQDGKEGGSRGGLRECESSEQNGGLCEGGGVLPQQPHTGAADGAVCQLGTVSQGGSLLTAAAGGAVSQVRGDACIETGMLSCQGQGSSMQFSPGKASHGCEPGFECEAGRESEAGRECESNVSIGCQEACNAPSRHGVGVQDACNVPLEHSAGVQDACRHQGGEAQDGSSEEGGVATAGGNDGGSALGNGESQTRGAPVSPV